MSVPSLSPRALAERLRQQDPPLLLDVRTPEERAFANLGGVHIPLADLPERHGELPRDREIVVYCHHGVRSLHAAHFLIQQGHPRVVNLEDGIEGWSLTVDPSVPRY